MGNSLIHFQEKKLWVHDFYLEPIIFFVSKLLSEKIEKQEVDKNHIEWFKTYNTELKDLFMGASDGALDLEFDLLKENEYRLTVVKDILTSIFSLLNSIDTNLNKDQFDAIGDYSFGNYANYDSSINTKTLAKEIAKILDFISLVDTKN